MSPMRRRKNRKLPAVEHHVCVELLRQRQNLLLPRQGRNVPRLWTQARQIFRRLWSPYPMVLRVPRRNVESQVRRRVRMTQGRSYHQDPGALCARCRLWTHVLCGIGGGMMSQGTHGTGLRDRFRHLLI